MARSHIISDCVMNLKNAVCSVLNHRFQFAVLYGEYTGTYTIGKSKEDIKNSHLCR